MGVAQKSRRAGDILQKTIDNPEDKARGAEIFGQS